MMRLSRSPTFTKSGKPSPCLDYGDKLHRSLIRMLDQKDGSGDEDQEVIDIEAWRSALKTATGQVIRAKAVGFLQQVDLQGLRRLATSAKELLDEMVAHEEIEAGLKQSLDAVLHREGMA